MCRSVQVDLSGTCRKLIKAIFAVVMKRAVVFAVWNSSTAVVVGLEPKVDGWKTSEVQRREATAVAVTVKAML